MKNFELDQLDNLRTTIDELQKQIERAIFEKMTVIDCEENPECYDDESINDHKNDFKAVCEGLKVFNDRYNYIYSEWLKSQENKTKQQSEIFKQMAEIFRPVNSENFNF